MISLPNFIYRILCAIPFVGTAFRRADFALVYTESHVDVPLLRFIEALVRTLPILVLAAAAYFLYDKVNSKEVIISDSQLVSSLALEDEEFREVLKDCETQQLVDFLSTTHDDPSLDLEARVIRFEKEIQIAQKIGRSKMRSNQWHGIAKEIELRSDLAIFDMENKVFDPDRHKELAELTNLYNSIQFPESTEQSDRLVEWAKYGYITTVVVEAVESGVSTDETVVVEDLKIKGGKFLGAVFDKTDIDKKLDKLARVANMRLTEMGLPTDMVGVLTATASGISSENESTRIAELAAMDCSNSIASEIPYKANATGEDTDNPAGFKDGYVKKFSEKFNLVFENDVIEIQDLEMMLAKLREVAICGWPQEASKMVGKLQAHLESTSKHAKLQDEVDRFAKLLGWGGREFLLDGFESLDKKQAKFHFASADATVVIFISNESGKASFARLNEIIGLLNKLAQSKAKNHFSIIFMHDQDKLNGLPRMRQIADSIPALKMWQLDVNSERGKKVTEMFSLDALPYALVLDRDKKVVGFDPKRMQLENILSKLKSPN